MQAFELIRPRLEPLKLGQNVEDAIDYMQEKCVSDLPVVDNGKVLGFIRLDKIHWESYDFTIDSYIETDNIFRVFRNVHEFELARFFSRAQLTTLAVIDATDNFEGIIPITKFVTEIDKRIERLCLTGENGGIVCLEMNLSDYSLSEIARIAEGNQARIIAMYIGQPDENSRMMEVNLYFDRPDVKNILASYERFNYNIKASHMSEEEWLQMRERYNALMKFINM